MNCENCKNYEYCVTYGTECEEFESYEEKQSEEKELNMNYLEHHSLSKRIAYSMYEKDYEEYVKTCKKEDKYILPKRSWLKLAKGI